MGKVLAALLLAAAGVYFAIVAYEDWRYTVEEMGQLGDPVGQIDYLVFRGAAQLIADGHKDLLYKPDEANALYDGNAFGVIPEARYLYPPAIAILVLPFTSVSVDTGFTVFSAISLLFASLVALGAFLFTRNVFLVLLAGLAIAALHAVQFTLEVGQPSLLLTAIMAVGAWSFVRGHDRLAAGSLALLVIKPQFAVLPLLLLLWRRVHWQAWAIYVAVTVMVGFLPFLYIGRESISDLFGVLRLQSDHNIHVNNALYLFNWDGFLAHLLWKDPDPVILAALTIETAVPMFVAWLNGDRAVALAAAVLASLLAMPHVIVYDWSIFVPLAMVLAFRPGPAPARFVTLFLLLAVHVGMSDRLPALVEGHYARPMWALGAAFFLLVWLSILPLVEAALRRDPLAARRPAVT